MNPPAPGHRLLLLSMPGGSPGEREEIRRLAAAVGDWDPILVDAERLGATALLGRALEEADAPRPASVDESCRAALVRGTLRILLAARVLSEALGALRRAGVDPLVLKGVPLAHELYDPPGLRPIGDIDLLVRRAEREAAFHALREAGYALPQGSLPLSFYFRHHFHVTLVRGGSEGMPIELHWEAQPRFSLSRIPVEALRARRRMVACDGVEAPSPGREELFLYLAQHFLRHLIAFGPETSADPIRAMLEPARRGRLTWLADLILLARREPGLDWGRVDRLAAEWGLEADISGLRRYLASIGVAPGRREPPGIRDGEAVLRIVRSGARHFPTLARASGGLQLRPILVARLWRFAFPGTEWIRWRYALGPNAGWLQVGARTARHATGVMLDAIVMALAIPIAWIGRRFSDKDVIPTSLGTQRNSSGASPNCPPPIT